MGAPKRLEKEPDSAYTRVKRARAKRLEKGICKNSGRHGKAIKGQECLRCWALTRAKRTGMTIENVMELELERLKREAHNHPTRDIKRPGECPACDFYHASQSNVTLNIGGVS